MRSIKLTLIPLILTVLFGCAQSRVMETVRTPVWALGGQAIIYAKARESRIFRGAPVRFDLWIADETGTPLERLLKNIDPAGLHPVALTPDGQSLACLRGGGETKDVVIVNLFTHESEELMSDVAVEPLGVCWDPNGQRLAMTITDLGMVALLDTVTGRVTRHAAGGQRVCDWVPGDEPRLLLTTNGGTTERNSLSLWSPGGGQMPREIFQTTAGGRIHSARVNPAGTGAAMIIQGSQVANWSLVFVDLNTAQTHVAWESPRPLVGLSWSPLGDAIHLSQMDRGVGAGWNFNRIALNDLQPTIIATHTAGCDASAMGTRVAVAVEGHDEIEVLSVDVNQPLVP